MTSISGFLRMIAVYPPVQRIGFLSVVVFFTLAIIALYASGWETYSEPVSSDVVLVEGRVSGYPDTWEHKRALVYFGVSYVLDGVREGKRVYTFSTLYGESGLRINSKVNLKVERLQEGSAVRELSTGDGRVLYDERLKKQIVAWKNESIRSTVFYCSLFALGFTLLAVITFLRHWREVLRVS